MIRRAALMVVATAVPLLAAQAAQVIDIRQVGRAFDLSEVTIKRGDVLRFTNADKFLHQVSVKAAGFNVTSNEQEPGTSLDVPFTVAGVFSVRCEIHPRMLLTVTVK